MLSSQSKKQSKKKKTNKSSKMMRRRERGKVLEAPDIPLDLLIEILNRLPIKSLARFKCVSKLWSSLISSQGYLFASPPHLYISFLLEETGHDPAKFVLYSLTSTGKSNTVFDIDSRLDGIGGFDMVALRGLILYNFRSQVCIWNPTTRQRVTLPAINILAGKKYIQQYDYFFGYDPVLDQYKILCSGLTLKLGRVYTQHWVFVLEAGSSWRKIEFDQPHIPIRRGLCINGAIYYLTSGFDSVFGDTVISFNVRYEEFNMIQVPEYLNSRYLGIVEYGGKPTIFDYKLLRDSLVNLWVLEDVGIWSKKSLDLQPCHMHFFPNNIYFDVDVVGTTQKGEVVLKPRRMSYPYYILYYDLHKNVVRRVDMNGISETPLNMAMMDTDAGWLIQNPERQYIEGAYAKGKHIVSPLESELKSLQWLSNMLE